MVSKLRPWRFGSRKVFRWESHVPSPTYMLLEEYTLVPGGDKPLADMVAQLLRACVAKLTIY